MGPPCLHMPLVGPSLFIDAHCWILPVYICSLLGPHFVYRCSLLGPPCLHMLTVRPCLCLLMPNVGPSLFTDAHCWALFHYRCSLLGPPFVYICPLLGPPCLQMLTVSPSLCLQMLTVGPSLSLQMLTVGPSLCFSKCICNQSSLSKKLYPLMGENRQSPEHSLAKDKSSLSAGVFLNTHLDGWLNGSKMSGCTKLRVWFPCHFLKRLTWGHLFSVIGGMNRMWSTIGRI